MAKRRIDFSGVPKEIRSSGRASRVPPGDYLLKIVKGEYRNNEDTGKSYYNWQFSITEPKQFAGRTVYDITSLKKDALWNLRNLIYAAVGKNVGGSIVNFDPDTLQGKTIGATLDDDEYTRDGRTTVRSRPVDYFQKTKYKKGAAVEDDEDEDEDEEEEEEEEEEDEAEDLEDVEVEDL